MVDTNGRGAAKHHDSFQGLLFEPWVVDSWRAVLLGLASRARNSKFSTRGWTNPSICALETSSADSMRLREKGVSIILLTLFQVILYPSFLRRVMLQSTATLTPILLEPRPSTKTLTREASEMYNTTSLSIVPERPSSRSLNVRKQPPNGTHRPAH